MSASEKILKPTSCVKSAVESETSEVILAFNERVIGRINLNGKWMEFWWKGETHLTWSCSCKAYKFFKLLDESQEHHRLNHGCVGMIVTWSLGYTLDPTAVRLPGL